MSYPNNELYDSSDSPQPQRPQMGPGSQIHYDLNLYEPDRAAVSIKTSRNSFAASSYAGSTYSFENAEKGAGLDENPKGLNRFFKTRRRMYLCCCCLFLLIFTAAFLPVLWFVIIPAIAQASVNASKMVVTSANITLPQEESFVMKMAGQVTDTGPFDAQIEIKDKVHLYYEGIELGQMAMEPMNAKAGVGATLDISPTFEIVNKTAFGDFAKVMMKSEEFTWTMKGVARAHAFGVTLDNIKLTKDIKLKGMSNFPGVVVKSFDLPSNHPLGGIAINAEASMQNPSPFGIVLGDLSFDVFYDDVHMAAANVTSVSVVPGVNTMSMKGRVLPQTKATDLEKLGGMFSNYVAGKSSPIHVIATEVRPNATAQPISWLQRGVAGTRLDVNFDGAKDAKFIQGLNLGKMSMAFSAADPWNPLTTAEGVVAKFKMPFGFPLEVKRSSQDITVYEGGSAMAEMKVPPIEVHGGSATGQMETSIRGVPMAVLDSQHAQFSQFISDVMMTSGKSLSMKGTASATASTAIGDITIHGITFDQAMSFQGFEGLSKIPISIQSVIVKGGTSEYAEIESSATIVNPTDMGISCGDVYFDVYFQGEKIARAKMPNMTMKPGQNTVQVIIYFGPKGETAITAGRKMMSDYIKGIENTVGISGNDESTVIAPLKQAFSAIRLTTKIPALHENLSRDVRFALGLNAIVGKANTQFVAYNPVDVAVAILRIDAVVSYHGGTIAELHQDVPNMVLAPRTTTESPVLTPNFLINDSSIRASFAIIGNSLVVAVQARVRVRIGGYVTEVDFSDNSVPAKIVAKL